MLLIFPEDFIEIELETALQLKENRPDKSCGKRWHFATVNSELFIASSTWSILFICSRDRGKTVYGPGI